MKTIRKWIESTNPLKEINSLSAEHLLHIDLRDSSIIKDIQEIKINEIKNKQIPTIPKKWIESTDFTSIDIFSKDIYDDLSAIMKIINDIFIEIIDNIVFTNLNNPIKDSFVFWTGNSTYIKDSAIYESNNHNIYMNFKDTSQNRKNFLPSEYVVSAEIKKIYDLLLPGGNPKDIQLNKDDKIFTASDDLYFDKIQKFLRVKSEILCDSFLTTNYLRINKNFTDQDSIILKDYNFNINNKTLSGLYSYFYNNSKPESETSGIILFADNPITIQDESFDYTSTSLLHWNGTNFTWKMPLLSTDSYIQGYPFKLVNENINCSSYVNSDYSSYTVQNCWYTEARSATVLGYIQRIPYITQTNYKSDYDLFTTSTKGCRLLSPGGQNDRSVTPGNNYYLYYLRKKQYSPGLLFGVFIDNYTNLAPITVPKLNTLVIGCYRAGDVPININLYFNNNSSFFRLNRINNEVIEDNKHYSKFTFPEQINVQSFAFFIGITYNYPNNYKTYIKNDEYGYYYFVADGSSYCNIVYISFYYEDDNGIING